MRKNFSAKPWVYPQPVFIIGTYDKNGQPNVMNAAWGGISDEKEISIVVSREHKTMENILLNKDFSLSMCTKDMVVSGDYVGIVSGNNTSNKFELSGFHEVKSDLINAPIILELPMTLECRMTSYNEDTEVLKGEILNISVDESVLSDGKIDINKVQPIIFNPIDITYHVIGDKVGNAFKDGKQLIKKK